ncbi:MAG: hypothetical protein IT210_24220 [Armatimonadetes bacterium]|nr:hypothetical protein [Armatimonadota bacterium]
MDQWEYKVLDHNRLNEEELNQLGAERFEIVSCFQYPTSDMGHRFIVILKRRKIPGESS